MDHGNIEWEHNPGEEFVIRFKPPPGKMVPEETVTHVKAAGKEMLLALRSLIDAALEMQEKAEKAGKKAGKRTKIEVE